MMAFVFDCTQKSTTQNSYVCTAEADDYFTGDPRIAVWSSLGTSEKEQYLVSATNRLEMENYGGTVTDSTQGISWPRANVNDRRGTTYDSDITPMPMQHATFEMAMWILEEFNEVPVVSRKDMARVSDFSVGPLSYTTRKIAESALPDVVSRLLRSIGVGAWSSNTATIKLVR